MNNKMIFLVGSVLLSFAMNAQITGGGNTKVEKVKPVFESEVKKPQVYFGTAYSLLFRDLDKNKDPLFGEELNQRAEETKIPFFNWNVGFRNRFHEHALLDIGLSFDKFGEKYAFTSSVTDSAYTYSNNYSALSIPVGIHYVYGKKIQFQIGWGMQFSLLNKYKSEIIDKNSLGSEKKSTVDFSNDLSSAGIATFFQLGVSARLSKNTLFFLLPKYQYFSSNFYAKQEAYSYRLKGLTINAGLVLLLK